ncbi:MAG: hypothetical protein H5T50_04535 [Nitrososphaeria archaeon]|nr:hypothetical protein [Nitrososphaeria archaeon]
MFYNYDMELKDLGIISDEKIEALKKENIRTCIQLLFASNDVIERYFSESERKEIFIKIEELFPAVYRFRELKLEPVTVTTSIKELDKILGGGISSANITEVCSEKRHRRTLFTYNIILNFLQLFEKTAIVYNDSNKMFRPEGLCELAHYRGIEEKFFLEKIFVFKPYTIFQQFEVFELLEKNIKSDLRILFVIDEIGDFFKSTTKRKDITFYNLRMLESFILRVNYFSIKYNMIVLLLNNLIKDFKTDAMEPQFNSITREVVGTRILFYEDNDSVRAKVIIGENVKEIRLSLTDYSISDAVDRRFG